MDESGKELEPCEATNSPTTNVATPTLYEAGVSRLVELAGNLEPYYAIGKDERTFSVNLAQLLKESRRLRKDCAPVYAANDIVNGVYKHPPAQDARYFHMHANKRQMIAFCDSGSRVVSFMSSSAANRLNLKIHRTKVGEEMKVQGIHGIVKIYRRFVNIVLSTDKYGLQIDEKVWITPKLAIGADLLASWRLSQACGLRLVNIHEPSGSFFHRTSADKQRENDIDYLLAQKNLLPGRSALDGYALPISFSTSSPPQHLLPHANAFEYDLPFIRRKAKVISNILYNETESEACFLSQDVYAEYACHSRIEEIFHPKEPSNNKEAFPTSFLATDPSPKKDLSTEEFYKNFGESYPNLLPQNPFQSTNDENTEEKENEMVLQTSRRKPPEVLLEKELGDLTEAEASKRSVIERIDEICAKIREVHLSENQLKDFRETLLKAKKQFATGEFDVGKFKGRFSVANIELKDPTKRHRAAPYRQSPQKEAIIEKRIQELIAGGIIEPCASPFSSPVILVAKKNGEWRMCVDYRKLNRNTKTQTFPMRNMSALLERVGHKKIFSSFDMRGGYYHMALSEEMAQLGAFVTSKGQYRPLVLMFGFADAPTMFQRKMEEIFGDLEDVEVYLDDIIIASDTKENHLLTLKKMMKRCVEADLKLHLKKCSFFKKRIKYLGHVIENGILRIDPDYANKILSMDIPTTQKELQQGLGLVNWLGSFIPRVSELTFPFHYLTSPTMKKNFEWNDDLTREWKLMQKEALSACKTELLQPDVTKPFVLQTDASKKAMGAVLLQKHPKTEIWTPVQFWSKSFASNTDHWLVAEKECCAVVKAFHHWRHLLIARDDTVVYTDHRNLVDLFNREKYHSPRMQRWAIFLSEFTFHAMYLKGSDNYISDYLSRYPSKVIDQSLMALIINDPEQGDNDGSHYAQSPCFSHHFHTMAANKVPNIDSYEDFAHAVETETQRKEAMDCLDEFRLLETETLDGEITLFNMQVLRVHQRNDLFLSAIILYLTDRAPGHLKDIPHFFRELTVQHYFDLNDNGLLVTATKRQIVLPAELRQQILYHFHASSLTSHLGSPKTLDLLSQRFWWKGMRTDVRKWVKSCHICQMGKNYKSSAKFGKMQTWHARERFQNISIDIVGPLPESLDGHKYILTCQDRFSRFTQAYPLRKADGITVATTLFNKWIAFFGAPRVVMSDQGTEFLNEISASLLKLCKTDQVLSTPYYPQSNGAIERFHRTLKTQLRCYFAEKHQNIEHNARWNSILPVILATYNASKHSAKGVSPYYIVFGCQFRFPSDNAFQTAVNADTEKKPTEKMGEWLQRMAVWHKYIARQIKAHIRRYDTSRLKYSNKSRKENPFAVGNIVMLRDEGKTGNKRKFGPQWVGPYIIYRIDRGNVTRLRRLDDKSERSVKVDNRRVNATKIKKWFPRAEETFSWENIPLDMDQEDEMLQKIISPSINRKKHHQKLQEKLALGRAREKALEESDSKDDPNDHFMDVDSDEPSVGPINVEPVEVPPSYAPRFWTDDAPVIPELRPMPDPTEIFDDIPAPPKRDGNESTTSEESEESEDDESSPEPYEPIVFTKDSYVKELRAELEKRNLKITGNKKVLIKRLNDYEALRDDIHPLSFVHPKMFLPPVPSQVYS